MAQPELEFDLTPEQAAKLEKAAAGEAVDLTQYEVGIFEKIMGAQPEEKASTENSRDWFPKTFEGQQRQNEKPWPGLKDAEQAPEAPPSAMSAVVEKVDPLAVVAGFGQGASFGFADELRGSLAGISQEGARVGRDLSTTDIGRAVRRWRENLPKEVPDAVVDAISEQIADEFGEKYLGLVPRSKGGKGIDTTTVGTGAETAYAKGRDLARQENANLQERSPVAFGAGELAGAVAVPLPGGAPAEGLGKLGKAGFRAAQGATLGGAYSLGKSEAETGSELLKDVGIGAGAGAVFSPVVGGITDVGGYALSRFATIRTLRGAGIDPKSVIPVAGKTLQEAQAELAEVIRREEIVRPARDLVNPPKSAADIKARVDPKLSEAETTLANKEIESYGDVASEIPASLMDVSDRMLTKYALDTNTGKFLDPVTKQAVETALKPFSNIKLERLTPEETLQTLLSSRKAVQESLSEKASKLDKEIAKDLLESIDDSIKVTWFRSSARKKLAEEGPGFLQQAEKGPEWFKNVSEFGRTPEMQKAFEEAAAQRDRIAFLKAIKQYTENDILKGKSEYSGPLQLLPFAGDALGKGLTYLRRFGPLAGEAARGADFLISPFTPALGEAARRGAATIAPGKAAEILTGGALEKFLSPTPSYEDFNFPDAGVGEQTSIDRTIEGTVLDMALDGVMMKQEKDVDSSLKSIFSDEKPTKPNMTGGKAPKDIHELASDPEALLQRTSEKTQALSSYAPAVASEMTATASRAVQYLSKLSAQPPKAGPMASEWTPSKGELRALSVAAGVVNDPMSVLTHAKSGTLTSEQMDALRAVYPQLAQQIQERTLEALTGNSKKVPYGKRLMLSLLSGTDVDGSLSSIPLNQAAIAQKNAKNEEQEQASSKGAQNLKSAERMRET